MHKSIYKNTKGLLALSTLLAMAQGAIAGNCPDRKFGRNQQACPGENHAGMEEVTFLGVYTTKVAPTLTRQLGFPRGFYLAVQHVEPGSPAQEAGLEAHDILQKVDDQILVNPEQLRELIRSKEAGTNVGLTFFREGKENTASAKLITREVPKHRGGGPREGFRNFNFQGDFPGFEDLKRRMPPRTEALPEGFRGKAWDFFLDADPFDPDPGKGGKNFQSSSQTHVSSGEQSTIQVNNQNGSLYLEMNDGKGKLTIRDKSGKNLYDGDYKPGQKIKGLSKQWQTQLQEIDIQLKKDCKGDKEKDVPKKGDERRNNKDKKNK